jgi:DNA-binding MarR family transcriptional regulator
LQSPQEHEYEKTYSSQAEEMTDPTDALTIADDAEAGNEWLEKFLPYQIYRVSSLMNIRLQGRLRASGINLSQWRVLSVLRSFGCLSLTQIVEHTLMEQPTVSRVVAQLEQDGVVERRISREDSRVAEVMLTSKGTALFDEISPSAVRHQRTALEGLPEEDLRQLRTLLLRIEQNIRRDR